MANRSVDSEAREAIAQFLAEAETRPPAVAPISRRAIADATGYHWKTINKYITEEQLQGAQRRQARHAKAEISGVSESLVKARREIEGWRERYEAVVAQLALVEGNARRLGYDPAELYRALPVPPRKQPHQPKRGRRHG